MSTSSSGEERRTSGKERSRAHRQGDQAKDDRMNHHHGKQRSDVDLGSSSGDESPIFGREKRPSRLKPSNPITATDTEGHRYRSGDVIEARFEGRSKWFPGTIQQAREGPRGEVLYDILYDDGDKEQHVPVGRVRRVGQEPPSLRAGLAVEVKLARKGKGYHSGTVGRVNDDGSLYVKLDDGDTEWSIPAQHVIASYPYAPTAANIHRDENNLDCSSSGSSRIADRVEASPRDNILSTVPSKSTERRGSDNTPRRKPSADAHNGSDTTAGSAASHESNTIHDTATTVAKTDGSLVSNDVNRGATSSPSSAPPDKQQDAGGGGANGLNWIAEAAMSGGVSTVTSPVPHTTNVDDTSSEGGGLSWIAGVATSVADSARANSPAPAMALHSGAASTPTGGLSPTPVPGLVYSSAGVPFSGAIPLSAATITTVGKNAPMTANASNLERSGAAAVKHSISQHPTPQPLGGERLSASRAITPPHLEWKPTSDISSTRRWGAPPMDDDETSDPPSKQPQQQQCAQPSSLPRFSCGEVPVGAVAPKALHPNAIPESVSTVTGDALASDSLDGQRTVRPNPADDPTSSGCRKASDGRGGNAKAVALPGEDSSCTTLSPPEQMQEPSGTDADQSLKERASSSSLLKAGNGSSSLPAQSPCTSAAHGERQIPNGGEYTPAEVPRVENSELLPRGVVEEGDEESIRWTNVRSSVQRRFAAEAMHLSEEVRHLKAKLKAADDITRTKLGQQERRFNEQLNTVTQQERSKLGEMLSRERAANARRIDTVKQELESTKRQLAQERDWNTRKVTSNERAVVRRKTGSPIFSTNCSRKESRITGNSRDCNAGDRYRANLAEAWAGPRVDTTKVARFSAKRGVRAATLSPPRAQRTDGRAQRRQYALPVRNGTVDLGRDTSGLSSQATCCDDAEEGGVVAGARSVGNVTIGDGGRDHEHLAFDPVLEALLEKLAARDEAIVKLTARLDDIECKSRVALTCPTPSAQHGAEEDRPSNRGVYGQAGICSEPEAARRWQSGMEHSPPPPPSLALPSTRGQQQEQRQHQKEDFVGPNYDRLLAGMKETIDRSGGGRDGAGRNTDSRKALKISIGGALTPRFRHEKHAPTSRDTTRADINTRADISTEDIMYATRQEPRYGDKEKDLEHDDLRWKLVLQQRDWRRRFEAMKQTVEAVVGQFRERAERAEALVASAEERARVQAFQCLALKRSNHL